MQGAGNTSSKWIVRPAQRTWIGLFVLALVIAVYGLAGSPGTNGKRLPEFTLSMVSSPQSEVTERSIRSRPALINVWASWCIACRTEHDFLKRLGRTGREPLYGLNHQDNREDAQRWLSYFGDPYRFSVYDETGMLGKSMQVDVLPVTFLIGGEGEILARHDGPLAEGVFALKFAPLLEATKEEAK